MYSVFAKFRSVALAIAVIFIVVRIARQQSALNQYVKQEFATNKPTKEDASTQHDKSVIENVKQK